LIAATPLVFVAGGFTSKQSIPGGIPGPGVARLNPMPVPLRLEAAGSEGISANIAPGIPNRARSEKVWRQNVCSLFFIGLVGGEGGDLYNKPPKGSDWIKHILRFFIQ
jgi:hypothetical protein